MVTINTDHQQVRTKQEKPREDSEELNVGYLSSIGPDQRPWLSFDAHVKHRRVRVLTDTGASHRFVSQRLVDTLRLEVQPGLGKIRLEGGNQLPIRGTADVIWHIGVFAETAEFTILDMQHDLILGEFFWKDFQVVPDYKTNGIRL